MWLNLGLGEDIFLSFLCLLRLALAQLTVSAVKLSNYGFQQWERMRLDQVPVGCDGAVIPTSLELCLCLDHSLFTRLHPPLFIPAGHGAGRD